MAAHKLLLFLMNLANVSIQRIFRAEYEFALDAMQLSGPFMHLFHMLSKSLGIEVDFSTSLTSLFKWLLGRVNAIFMLDEAVVGLEPLGAVAAQKGKTVMSLSTMLDYLFGSYPF